MVLFLSIIQMSQFTFSYKTGHFIMMHTIYFLNYLKIQIKLENLNWEFIKLKEHPTTALFEPKLINFRQIFVSFQIPTKDDASFLVDFRFFAYFLCCNITFYQFISVFKKTNFCFNNIFSCRSIFQHFRLQMLVYILPLVVRNQSMQSRVFFIQIIFLFKTV